MGLALCDRLAAAMDGVLTATSELGKGSRFMLRLPLDVETLHAALPKFPAERVMVVADEPNPSVIDVLSAWRLRPLVFAPDAHKTTAGLTAARASVVIFWGDCQTLDFEQRNNLIADASCVIECRGDYPCQPVVAGRLVKVSIYGLKGLLQALEYACFRRLPMVLAPEHYVLSRRISILLVEDHVATRRLLQEQLAQLGCEVHAVSDGAQAVRVLESLHCEVMITDLHMPGMSGVELVNLVRQDQPHMPILILTAGLKLQMHRRFEQDEHTKVIGKPIALRELALAISEVSGVDAIPAKHETSSPALSDMPISDELLELFFNANERSLEVMQRAWKDADAERLQAELHSVRGALSVFGMDFLSQQSAELSEALKTGDLQACQARFARFCFELRLALKEPGREALLAVA